MPRRSTRIKQVEDQKDFELADDEPSKTELKSVKVDKNKTNSKKTESVSNENEMSMSPDQNKDKNEKKRQEDKSRMSVDVDNEQKEQSQSAESSVDIPSKALKRLSIDPSTAMPPINQEEEVADDNNSDDDYIDDVPKATIAATRSRRSNRPAVSYKDESDSEDEESESESSDCDDPLFAGLNKSQRASLRAKMSGIQSNYKESQNKEKTLKINEIISSFDFNCGEKVSNEEASFIYDFCQKHQYDINDKIEDEGDFFLVSMREMMEEKAKLNQAQNGKKKKKSKGDDSESEFDADEYDDSDSSCSEYTYSDWENPDQDNENMISDEEWDGGVKAKKKKRRRNHWHNDGKEYRCVGRLLLEDALKDTENFEGWSEARVHAWKNKDVNPNAYYYRFNAPGEAQKNGRIEMDEHKVFMERVKEVGVNMHWGNFSIKIPGRVGYQCSNYWRQMMKDQWVKDPNYWIRADGSFCFKRAKKGSVPDAIRKFSFVVLKDPSKVFDEPGYHPKRPSDSKLTKYLQDNVRDIVNKKKGGKSKKKRAPPKKRGGDGDDDGDKPKEKRVRSTKSANGKKPKDPNKPKNPLSAYFLFMADVREKYQAENKGMKMGQISKLIGAEWKSLSDDDKKQYVEKNKALRAEWMEKMAEYKKSENYKEYLETLKKWEEEQMKDDEEEEEEEDKKDKVEAVEVEDKNESDKENENKEEESDNKARGKKRKHSSDGAVSDLEPPQKKRKISPKKKADKVKKKKSKKKAKKSKKKEEADEEEEAASGPLSEVLGDMVDIMTGEKLQQPAISPYGHVMEYNSWCSVLRNARTKNKCPFTKQKLTRRSLVKLDDDNIEEYKDKIVNISEEDMKCLKE